MNKQVYSFMTRILLIVACSLFTLNSFATPPAWDEDGESGVDDEAAPIDGYVYLVLAVGMILSYKSLSKKYHQ